MKHLPIIVILTLAAPVARAQGFEKFVANLSAAPAEAAKRFASCQVVVAPNGEVREPCSLVLADLTGGQAGATLAATHVKRQAFPKSLLEWIEADVEARNGKQVIATFHVVELGRQGNPDHGDGWIVTAQAWNKLITDSAAFALAKANQLPTPPKITEGTLAVPKGTDAQAAGDRDEGLHTARQTLDGGGLRETYASFLDSGAIIIGSAPNQRLTGKAGGKEVRGWKLEFAKQGGIADGGSDMVLWQVTHVVGTTRDKVPVATPYVTFAVFVQRMTAGGGSPVTEPALVQFSIVH